MKNVGTVALETVLKIFRSHLWRCLYNSMSKRKTHRVVRFTRVNFTASKLYHKAVNNKYKPR